MKLWTLTLSIIVTFSLCCAGCYRSTSLSLPGDARFETTPEALPDAAAEEMPDLSPDPGPDPRVDDGHDAFPDPPEDRIDDPEHEPEADLFDLPDAESDVPILYYPFEYDVQNHGSLAGHHGTWHGAPEYREGKFGMAVTFDPDAGNHVVFDGTREPMSAYGSCTIGLWFKEDYVAPLVTLINFRSRWGGLESYHGAYGNQYLVTCYTMENRVDVCLGDMIDYSGPDGTWHHVIFREEGTDFRIYIDGEIKYSAVNEARTFSPLQQEDLMIGHNYTGDPMNSNFYVDELKIFNRVFSDDEQCATVIGGLWAGDRCILP
jgi:hypothetical protein